VQKNIHLGGLICTSITFSYVEQSSPGFFCQRGRVVVVQLRVKFLTCRPVPRIFAPKLGRFLALPNFRGNSFQKLYARYHPCIAIRRLEKFHEDIPSSPEVIGVHMLNFKPNFKFSRLEFFGGTPVPLRVCAIKVWSISSACKIFGAQHPLWAEI